MIGVGHIHDLFGQRLPPWPWNQTVAGERMKRAATISSCGAYRYWLEREWCPGLGTAVFVMFNPSTADADVDDPTIRRCFGFAYSWSLGRIVVVNLFAYRTAFPKELKRAVDPIGPENLAHIDRACALVKSDVRNRLICAWGAHGEYRDQGRAITSRIAAAGITPMCFAITKNGHPAHPLYQATFTKLKPYTIPSTPAAPSAAEPTPEAA